METRADFCIDYEERAALLKALANPVRLRILHVLRTEGCRNVRCIEARTGMSQSCISQHLQRLRSARLVGAERVGNEVFYQIASPEVAELVDTLTEREWERHVL